jgi:hypothetical protein
LVRGKGIRAESWKVFRVRHPKSPVIAEYLERGGKILKAGAAYGGGTAPYRTDKRSNKQVMADRFGEPVWHR